MKEKYNFAVIGCGHIGKRHCNIIKELPEANLVAVCDIKKEKVDEYAKQFGAKTYYDYNEMLKDEDIDVITICTPSGMHAKMTIDSANAKKHVICEKPMAMNLEECDQMIESCKQNNVRLFVVKQNRFNEPVALLKQAIEKQKLGKPYLISARVLWNRNEQYYKDEPWRGTKEQDGGALMNQSSHFVDLLCWLGGDIKKVYSKMDTFNHDIETEDTGVVILEFANGAIGAIEYTTCIYDKNLEGSFTFFGTKGSVKIGGKYLNEIEHWNVEGMPAPVVINKLKPNYYGTYQGSAANHGKVFENVIDILKGRTNKTTEGRDARKAVEVIIAAKKSAETGQPVELPLK